MRTVILNRFFLFIGLLVGLRNIQDIVPAIYCNLTANKSFPVVLKAGKVLVFPKQVKLKNELMIRSIRFLAHLGIKIVTTSSCYRSLEVREDISRNIRYAERKNVGSPEGVN
jgi:hypothetical protein